MESKRMRRRRRQEKFENNPMADEIPGNGHGAGGLKRRLEVGRVPPFPHDNVSCPACHCLIASSTFAVYEASILCLWGCALSLGSVSRNADRQPSSLFATSDSDGRGLGCGALVGVEGVMGRGFYGWNTPTRCLQSHNRPAQDDGSDWAGPPFARNQDLVAL